jgi:molybdenum cofactor cytidylyltransferase
MTGLLILAAGSSSRLGQPKQQLVFKGKTLLQHAVDEALHSHCSPIFVVLGANESSLRSSLYAQNVRIVVNPDWETGMASSIRCGVEALLKNEPNISQAIVMLCDQPFVDAEILNVLIDQKEKTGKAIVACTYDNTLGTPVLFDRSFFPQLLTLKGQQGAKKLVFDHVDQVSSVPFAFGNIDIDTIEDYQKLQTK